ncbi:MAG: valine--tRNA ligase [Cytophagales bacterium]|nr:MAG: valine--tRNA ligase [Cytophagales bacterium]
MSEKTSPTLEKKYNPQICEDKWYQYWLNNKFFSSTPNPNKEPYTIVIPPPNVTGVLHMGHMLNNTIQDILIRKARMQGKEACWVPGTDHASIATEAKVVAMLKDKGIDKKSISREEFLKYAWEWKEKYGGIILEQLKKLGASCDWDRTRFTMEPNMSEAVIKVFIDLHRQGLVYKGFRMVNWDPSGKTALSDEEVIHKEIKSKLYYLKYKIVESDEYITVATTRPETIYGDTALCVNPEDERYIHLKNKQVIIPIIDRAIPVIFDEYVDKDFGTGALKVTPAHDINDYQLGQKHQLPIIDIFTEDGKMNEKAIYFVGEDRFVARKKTAKLLEEKELLVKVEEITNNVGFSERTDAVVEPRISAQWFIDMKKFMSNNPEVLEAVMNDEIAIYPAKFKNTYRHWIENIKDWCISRQLWWGQQIPVWYLNDGNYVVAHNAKEALLLAQEKFGATITENDLTQDEDVLDTWFSSWLWPISVFDGFANPNNEDIKYYYPTNDLVTAPEILFFWVARMIMAGYEFKKEKPFKNVYLTGIVRDKQGRKMSKSLGNSPDPLDLITKYSADGVRVGMLLSSPAGNDLLFDEKLCEQGRNFTNKIWNALRLIKGWDISETIDGKHNQIAIDWFESKYNFTLLEIENHFSKYKLSEALHTLYKLVWDDFCAWYLEMIKPAYGLPIDRNTYDKTVSLFEQILKLVHPFMPFISEELWHEIKPRVSSESLIISEWPRTNASNEKIIEQMNLSLDVVANIRTIKANNKLAKHELVTLYIKTKEEKTYQLFEPVIKRLANVDSLFFTNTTIDNAQKFVINSDEFFIPVTIEINVEQEKENLLKEIAYTRGFLESVESKLGNEKFIKSAPPKVIEIEQKKKSDALSKLKTLEDSFKNIK